MKKKVFCLVLLAVVALNSYADTVKGTAKPSGSKVFTWVQNADGPAAVTAALKSTRITAMGVFDGDADLVCIGVGGSPDRLLRCEFDAIGGEFYQVLLLTGSGKNKFDLTVQSGSGEFVSRTGAVTKISEAAIEELRNRLR